MSLCWHKDGQVLVAGGSDATIRVYEVSSGNVESIYQYRKEFTIHIIITHTCNDKILIHCIVQPMYRSCKALHHIGKKQSKKNACVVISGHKVRSQVEHQTIVLNLVGFL